MTERTLMRYIQAMLPAGEQIHKARPGDERGPYFIIDHDSNTLVACCIDDLHALVDENEVETYLSEDAATIAARMLPDALLHVDADKTYSSHLTAQVLSKLYWSFDGDWEMQNQTILFEHFRSVGLDVHEFDLFGEMVGEIMSLCQPVL